MLSPKQKAISDAKVSTVSIKSAGDLVKVGNSMVAIAM